MIISIMNHTLGGHSMAQTESVEQVPVCASYIFPMQRPLVSRGQPKFLTQDPTGPSDSKAPLKGNGIFVDWWGPV